MSEVQLVILQSSTPTLFTKYPNNKNSDIHKAFYSPAVGPSNVTKNRYLKKAKRILPDYIFNHKYMHSHGASETNPLQRQGNKIRKCRNCHLW